MNFNSFQFAIFLPIVFVLYWSIPHKFRWILLLGSSYYFYMSWNVKYIVLIFATTVVSYVSALLLEKTHDDKKRKLIIAIALVVCLGILFFFKYFNFFSKSLCLALNSVAIKVNPVLLSLLLPVGISFYTFQTLSYVIDVYRGTVKAEHHFGIYAAFISFFPQLVAGPIERTNNLLPQIKMEHHFDYEKATYGLKLMAWGYFKKMCIADVLAVYVDNVYSSLGEYYGMDLVIAVVFFTIQIYCDFSGYSDIAIGCSKLMGIDLMTNFKSPYFSSSVKEFWSRWHISLSTWFRDYVYIPLGGNRCNKARHYMNLLITFGVSGLWHGASWTFVVWGGLHGAVQVIENILEPILASLKNKKGFKILFGIIVFVFCNIAWVFFRAESFNDAYYVIRHLLSGIKNGKSYFSNTLGLNFENIKPILVSLSVLAVYDYFSLKTDVINWISKRKCCLRWGVYIAFCLYIAFQSNIGDSSFIYFQF